MSLLKNGMIIFAFLVSCFCFNKQYKADMTIVYPDDCSFSFDNRFSCAEKIKMKEFIDVAYKKNKKPSNLLPSIEQAFASIKSIIIDMQNPELLSFTIQAHQPLCMLNDCTIVCQQGQLFDKDVFANTIISKLENVSYDGQLHQKDIDRLMKFITSLSDPILKEFSIRWLGKYNVWLDQKQGQDLSLLVGYQRPPTMKDVEECRKLRGQVIDKPCKDRYGKSLKKKTTWVCDLRFDQQIILFSTNKGG